MAKAKRWKWEIHPQINQIELRENGDTVLRPIRWGMQSASLQVRSLAGDGSMASIHTITQAEKGREHHSDWYQVPLPHPDLSLIAAAPQLLEACKQAIQHFEEQGYCADHYDIIETLREAVECAKGKEV